ncbi:MAG: PAS domain-containing protein [Hyphomicrobiales bacterium]|nr:MAG: PAS domain-containing protein [Hyphomicrobiales bacterium]
MKHRNSKALYEYWNELRGAHVAPKRSELDPQAIAPLLGDIFILERRTSVEYCFRLAGTRLCSAYGRELRHMNLVEMWTGQDRENIETLLYSVTEDGAAAIVGLDAVSAKGNHLPMEMVLLPLFQDNGRLNRVLGGLVPLKSAYWIGVDSLIKQQVKSLRLIMPERSQAAKVVQAGRPHSDFGRSVPTRTSVNLRVIDGGLADK